jgi:pyruvate kinase
MARTSARAEAEASYAQWAHRLANEQRHTWPEGTERITMAITHAAAQAAADAGAEAIICCTKSGRTARAMSSFRPSATLIAASPDPATVRSMALSWGVRGMLVDTYGNTDDLVWHAVESAVHRGFVHRGQIVMVLAGAPDRPSGAATDVLRIVRID